MEHQRYLTHGSDNDDDDDHYDGGECGSSNTSNKYHCDEENEDDAELHRIITQHDEEADTQLGHDDGDDSSSNHNYEEVDNSPVLI
mmetsp:Transcript_175/g.255  ORF Transcript_175/g.255 Transcript_175/m.255 type:complete len:86 (+) Transcript_175:10-267(+)